VFQEVGESIDVSRLHGSSLMPRKAHGMSLAFLAFLSRGRAALGRDVENAAAKVLGRFVRSRLNSPDSRSRGCRKKNPALGRGSDDFGSGARFALFLQYLSTFNCDSFVRQLPPTPSRLVRGFNSFWERHLIQ
jgi:hypothetical protein